VIRLVIADDQGMVRRGLASLLGMEPDVEVVGEAENGEQAVHEVVRLKPDVALMDIRMPVMDGLQAMRLISRQQPDTRLIALTTFDLDEYVFEALRAGASGFLLKDAPAEDLAAAIRTVAAGDGMLAPGVTRRVIDAFATSVRPPRPDLLAGLTAREEDILRLIARGFSNADIAERLSVSPATVKTHVSSVLAKLDLRDRVQAVIVAYEAGLVRPGEPD
jgi:DNA-binding NarL/FixJ family response regulator